MDFKNGGSSSDRKPAAPAVPLARQGSIYSLTFDEFQSTLGGMRTSLGKDFGSMNMDELLRSIWTAEESQAMASASIAAGAGAADGTPLQRQGSLTLPRTLSVKTVDEVWRDFVRDAPSQQDTAASGAGPAAELQQQRQPTLGEMTLEEFFVRAGVVREDPAAAQPVPARPMPIAGAGAAASNSTIFYGNFANSNDASAGALGFAPVGIGDPAMSNGLMPGVVGMRGGGVAAGAAESAMSQLDAGGKGGNGDLSSPMAPVPYAFEGVMRGRRSSGGVEKVVERRQRRMIKNRESAARSRARKQAYTMELEAEVAKLKEQNQELQKKQGRTYWH